MLGGNIQYKQLTLPNGAPFPPGTALNGLSVDASGFLVLGNDAGDPAQPAILLNDREIPSGGNQIRMIDGSQTNTFLAGGFSIDDTFSGNTLIGTGSLELSRNNGIDGGRIYLRDITNTIFNQIDSDNPGLEMRSSTGRRFFVADHPNNTVKIGDPDFATFGMQLAIDNANPSVGVYGNRGYLALDQASDIFAIGSNTQNAFGFAETQLYLNNALKSFYLQSDQLFIYGDNTVGTIKMNAANGVEITNDFAGGFVIINGTPGFTGTVTPVTSITVEGGIVTSVS